MYYVTVTVMTFVERPSNRNRIVDVTTPLVGHDEDLRAANNVQLVVVNKEGAWLMSALCRLM